MWIDKDVLPLGVKLDDVVLMKRRDGSVAGPGEAGTFIWCNYDSPKDITHYVVIDGKLKEALAGGNPLIRWAPAPGSAPNVPCEALSRVIVVFRNGYVHGPDIAGKIRWWHFEAGKNAEDIIFYCVVKTDYSAAAEITMGDGLKTSITVGERTIHIKATDEKCPTISSCVHSYENNDDGIRQALKWLLEG